MSDLKQLAIKTLTAWSGCRDANGEIDQSACEEASLLEKTLFAAINQLEQQLATER